MTEDLYRMKATMKCILLGLLLSIGLIGCAGLDPAARAGTPTPTNAPTPTNTVLQDDAAIYNTVLPVVFGQSSLYVISQTTFTPAGDLALPEGVMPALTPQTLADFNAQNRQSFPLDTVFTGQDPHDVLVDRASFYEKPTAENGLSCTWMRTECFNEPKFRDAYPGASGIILLARIGYNADRTQALVVIQQDRGQDSGISYVILMVKAAGQWQVVDRYEIHWII